VLAVVLVRSAVGTASDAGPEGTIAYGYNTYDAARSLLRQLGRVIGTDQFGRPASQIQVFI
jgi:hypothetical protein